MNDENRTSNFTEPTVRITRARAKVLRPSNGLPPLYPSAKQDDRRVLRANSKRAASDNNKTAASSAACPQHKRRAVLKDVTNITCQSLYINCTNAAACQVSEEYRLVPDTLYLTVNLIDRFLSENYIEKQKLQLLGVTCMLIASKYEEICAPRVEEFCFITDNTYTKEENPTLEHYTRYKTSELKTAVRELQDLQLNTSGCMLNAVREKYRQPKVRLESFCDIISVVIPLPQLQFLLFRNIASYQKLYIQVTALSYGQKLSFDLRQFITSSA
ncbi:UNVERIFIED_CONTAM: Cyclin-A2-1 [Sesamum indicum]